MFKEVYKGKKVLITGNTGFKGSWLTVWLLRLGAKVIGVSKNIPTNPSMFEVLNLSDKIKFYRQDIRELLALQHIIEEEKPDFIFHLAAQPIVSVSYTDPIETITSNVIGTTNILEALRLSNHECIAIMITSDKAYDNIEQVWGYKEDDKMGGKDIYSGSKGAAELIIKSYFHSFLKLKNNIRLAIARAGNVVGGGDWAQDRIVVDCMIAWSKGEKVKMRCPNATRPWQHVLEPLCGYLTLGQSLYLEGNLNGEGFNFGPKAEQNHTVKQLLIDLSHCWNFKLTEDAFIITDNIPFQESGLLKLNCDKALFYLKWQANWLYHETIKYTGEWYYNFYRVDTNMYNHTLRHIDIYEQMAKENKLIWTE